MICHILILKLKISQNIIFRKKSLPQLLQPLFGIRLMMRVFLSITALNIVIDSQNIKFLLKLTFFESGPHGVSLANRTTAPSDAYCLPSVHRWVSWASDWLERQIKN